MEIIAAKPAGHIDRLADRVEPGDSPGRHRLRRQFGGGDAADRHFGLRETLAAVGGERPGGEARFGGGKTSIRRVRKRLFEGEPFAQRFGETVGKLRGERSAKRRARRVALGRAEPGRRRVG